MISSVVSLSQEDGNTHLIWLTPGCDQLHFRGRYSCSREIDEGTFLFGRGYVLAPGRRSSRGHVVTVENEDACASKPYCHRIYRYFKKFDYIAT